MENILQLHQIRARWHLGQLIGDRDHTHSPALRYSGEPLLGGPTCVPTRKSSTKLLAAANAMRYPVDCARKDLHKATSILVTTNGIKAAKATFSPTKSLVAMFASCQTIAG
jgi:hypothetical protein